MDPPKTPRTQIFWYLLTRWTLTPKKTSKTLNIMGVRPVKSINQSIIRCNGFIFVFITCTQTNIDYYYIEDVYGESSYVTKYMATSLFAVLGVSPALLMIINK